VKLFMGYSFKVGEARRYGRVRALERQGARAMSVALSL
jgi:hypothetical protein